MTWTEADEWQYIEWMHAKQRRDYEQAEKEYYCQMEWMAYCAEWSLDEWIANNGLVTGI